MRNLEHYLFCTVLIFFQACQVYAECIYLDPDIERTISHTVEDGKRGCWIIHNPHNETLVLHIRELNLPYGECTSNYLRIENGVELDTMTLCKESTIPFILRFGTNIELSLRAQTTFFRELNFQADLLFELKVDDIEGVSIMKTEIASMLYGQRSGSSGWKENTARALTVLYLSKARELHSEDMMVKELELEIALAFLRSTISPEQLSMFIHALLLVCHNPRHFYGKDLVKLLKDTVEETNNVSHPIVYLALCNANESWPIKADQDLLHVLQSDFNYNYVRDLQAISLMAVNCYNKTNFVNNKENVTLFNESRRIAHEFTQHQSSDGSFGNIQTTALLMQSLISSKQISPKTWKLEKAVTYLLKKMNSTEVDFLTYYWALPVLSEKSLSDIIETNCTGHQKYAIDDTTLKAKHYIGPKIQIQYSLYIGNEADVIHTIFFKVPQTFTAFKIMQLAEKEDPKYGFQWKDVSGKKEIHKISNLSNDPETGKFWILNLKAQNSSSIIPLSSKDPDKITLGNDDHLIMWFRSVNI